MRWRIMLELDRADGMRQVYEVGAGERSPSGHGAATLGLQLEEGKAILAALRRHPATASRPRPQPPATSWHPQVLDGLMLQRRLVR